MRESAADTASVQIHDLAVFSAGKNHAPAEGIPSLFIDQTDFAELIERAADVYWAGAARLTIKADPTVLN